MPPDEHVHAQSETPVWDDEINLARVDRPGGTIILAPWGMRGVIENWTGQVAVSASAIDVVGEMPTASPGVRLLCMDGQLSVQSRQVLASKGYGVTIHTPSQYAPHGGVLIQSETPVFDDEITI